MACNARLSWLALPLLGVPVLGAAQAPSTDPAAPARYAMINALGAPNPNPAMGSEARTFDRLVGTWDCAFTFYLEDGSVRKKTGKLLLGWIMDGRAVQDIWITYRPEQRDSSIGTSLRFFDTKLTQWRVVFLNPRANYLVTVQGGMEGDRIVLHGTDTDGLPIRWSFHEITDDSFTWRGEKSHDGGKTWKLEEEHHMTRHGG